MYKSLKQAREYLKLSREFVARQMGLPCDEIIAIEDGKREVNSEEMDFFQKLYGLNRKELLYGNISKDLDGRFVSEFSRLSATDKEQIINLQNFRCRYCEFHSN